MSQHFILLTPLGHTSLFPLSPSSVTSFMDVYLQGSCTYCGQMYRGAENARSGKRQTELGHLQDILLYPSLMSRWLKAE